MLLREIKKIFHKELDALYGKEEVSSFFYLLIEHFLNLERFVLAVEPTLILEKQEESKLFAALSDLKRHRPIQHIIGFAHFMDMEFKVGPVVLIPRPETEELVRWVLEDSKEEIGMDVLDLGTGSGCIAISLSKLLKNSKVQALDVSQEALKIAKENARLNNAVVDFFSGDILNLIIEQKFDIIVSNPPYVRQLEKNKMHNNVLIHEPKQALFVSDSEPLIFYEKIAGFATKNLKPNGILYLEINQYLGEETCELLSKFNFIAIELRKDLYGNDRFIKAKK